MTKQNTADTANNISNNQFEKVNILNNAGVLSAIFIGNALEFFDFMLFAHLAPIIGKYFFPSDNALIQHLSGLAIFILGFIARPLGAYFFGTIGDKNNRQSAVIRSVIFMSLPTLIISFLPTYYHIGIAAPLILILLRTIQGFAIGGEYCNAGIYLMETYPDQQFKFSSYFSASCQIGSLLALLFAYYILSNTQIEWLWRIPFFFGFISGLIGIYLRKKLLANIFQAIKPKFINFKDLIKTNYKNFLYFMLYCGFTGILIWIPITFTSIYTTKYLAYTYVETITINTVSIISYMLSIILIYLLSKNFVANDPLKVQRIIIKSSLLIALTIIPIFMLLVNNYIWLFQIILTFYAGLIGGGVHMIGVNSFYASGVSRLMSLGHAIGMTIIGSTSPFFATYLISLNSTHLLPAIYIGIMAILNFYFFPALKLNSNNIKSNV